MIIGRHNRPARMARATYHHDPRWMYADRKTSGDTAVVVVLAAVVAALIILGVIA